MSKAPANNPKRILHLEDAKVGEVIEVGLNESGVLLVFNDQNSVKKVKATVLKQAKYSTTIGWEKEAPKAILHRYGYTAMKTPFLSNGKTYNVSMNFSPQNVVMYRSATIQSSSIGFLLGCIGAAAAINHLTSSSSQSIMTKKDQSSNV